MNLIYFFSFLTGTILIKFFSYIVLDYIWLSTLNVLVLNSLNYILLTIPNRLPALQCKCAFFFLVQWYGICVFVWVFLCIAAWYIKLTKVESCPRIGLISMFYESRLLKDRLIESIFHSHTIITSFHFVHSTSVTCTQTIHMSRTMLFNHWYT